MDFWVFFKRKKLKRATDNLASLDLHSHWVHLLELDTEHNVNSQIYYDSFYFLVFP